MGGAGGDRSEPQRIQEIFPVEVQREDARGTISQEALGVIRGRVAGMHPKHGRTERGLRRQYGLRDPGRQELEEIVAEARIGRAELVVGGAGQVIAGPVMSVRRCYQHGVGRQPGASRNFQPQPRWDGERVHRNENQPLALGILEEEGARLEPSPVAPG